MNAPLANELIPRRAVLAGGAVMAASLVAVGWVSLQRRAAEGPAVPPAQRPVDAVLQARTLRFDDRPDGGIDVVDARSGAVLETLHGEQGFVRGVLRSLVRERRRNGLAPQAPFTLMRASDGRLALSDADTEQRIDLQSFGPDNAAAFARWLPARP